MSVLWIALPVTLALAAGFVIAFVLAARRGQYDDTDTPPIRMLIDDEPAPPRKREPVQHGEEERSRTP